MKEQEITWVPPWLPEEADIFGYPDSLIRARTARAYEFAIQKIGVKNKICLDLGSGWGHGSLRCYLSSPRLVISSARFSGALLKQKEWFAPAKGTISYTQLLADHLPYPFESIEVIFFHHLIEHLSLIEAKRAMREMGRVLTETGKVSLATPNRYNLVKPRQGENYYSLEELTVIMDEFFRQVEPYSLIPNEFAQMVHRRKRVLARIPLTGLIRDLIPNQWEFLYGSGRRKVLPSDFAVIPGFDSTAIDFLVIASRPRK